MAGSGEGVNLTQLNQRMNDIVQQSEAEVNELLDAPVDPNDTQHVFKTQMAMQRLSLTMSVSSAASKSVYDTLKNVAQRI